MKNSTALPRILMLLGIISLSLVFLFPLWQITLDAAQFPGGLRLNIWINQLSGGDEGGGDIIQNVNILNHYIGMKFIEPDSIAELQYFPYIIMGMMLFAAIATVINSYKVYALWLGVLSILGALGIYDFYLWLYDYGHNLDPNAPIKVSGMTYMPPLLGEKDLLNFYVTSYPHLGTLFLSVSAIAALLACFIAYQQAKKISLQ